MNTSVDHHCCQTPQQQQKRPQMPMPLEYGNGPKSVFEVGNIDEYGSKQVFGYGVCHLPTASGMHEIECPVWRVVGSTLQEAYSFFLDIKPQLRDKALICQNAQSDRQK